MGHQIGDGIPDRVRWDTRYGMGHQTGEMGYQTGEMGYQTGEMGYQKGDGIPDMGWDTR